MQKDIAMKLINFMFYVSIGLAISGCVTTKSNKIATPAATTQSQKNTAKNPISVTIYTGKQKPEKPYVVLGHESVSKYNIVGIKRQEANLKDSIRRLAANKGGDAVIEITNHVDSISYTVISYKNSLADTMSTDKA
jgi:biopolymer transport protein ExbD